MVHGPSTLCINARRLYSVSYLECADHWGRWKKKNDKYKGDLIIEKATGKSVSPPEWESEDEEEEDGEVSEEEVTVAMAAVRVE